MCPPHTVFPFHAAAMFAAFAAGALTPLAHGDAHKADNLLPLNDPASWLTDCPGAQDVAIFSSLLASSSTFNLGDDLQSWRGIRITNPAGDITINPGNTLALGDDGIDLSAATRNVSLHCAISLMASQSFTSATMLSLTAALNLSSHTLSIAGPGATSLGPITGTGAIVKAGEGILSLTRAGSFSGGVTLHAGTLALSNASSPGTGTLCLLGGSLLLNPTTAFTTFANPICASGTGTLQQSATSITLSGPISGNGVIRANIAANTLSLSHNTTAGAFTGLLDFGTSNGTLRLARFDDRQLENAALDLGTGTMRLLCAEAGLHPIAALSGDLGTSIRAASGSPNIATTFILGAANTSTTFAGSILNGTGNSFTCANLTKTGTGTLTLTGTASNYSGSLNIHSGALYFNTTAALGTATSAITLSSAAAPATLGYFGAGATSSRYFTILSAATLDASGSGPIAFSATSTITWGSPATPRTLTLTGTSTAANLLNLRLIDNGVGAVRLIKSGLGTWIIGNTHNSFSGGVTIEEGSIILKNLTGSPLGSGPLTIHADATLQLGNDSNSGLAYNTSIDLQGTLAVCRTDALTMSLLVPFATLLGQGTLHHRGSGTLTLDRPLSGFAHTLHLTGGKVILDPATATDRLCALTIDSDIDGRCQASLDLGATSLIVQTAGDAEKSAAIGTLRAAISQGTADTDGGIYSHLAAGDPALMLGFFDNGHLGKTTWGGLPVDSDSLILAVAQMGDSNADGVVNIVDLATVANNWQNPSQIWSAGDVTSDGIVDILDLAVVANNWQASYAFTENAAIMPGFAVSSQIGAFFSVPEPGSVLPLLWAGLALLRRLGAPRRHQ